MVRRQVTNSRGYVTVDRWRVTGDSWQVKGDWWQVTGNRWQENKMKINSSRTQFAKKQIFLHAAILDPFWAKVLQSETTLGSGGKKTFKPSEQMTKIRGNLTQFLRKKFQIWDHCFLLLLPKDSENLKSLDIGLRKVGANRPLNRVDKWREINLWKNFFRRGNFTPFLCKKVLIWPLLSITIPQGFWLSQKFGPRKGGQKDH